MSAPGSGEQGVLVVQYGPYGGKGKIPAHHDYVELAIARTWNYHDAPTHVVLPLSAAAQQERRERAYFRDEPGETRLHLSTYTAGYLACLKDLGLGES